jgi:hypothetical protein
MADDASNPGTSTPDEDGVLPPGGLQVDHDAERLAPARDHRAPAGNGRAVVRRGGLGAGPLPWRAVEGARRPRDRRAGDPRTRPTSTVCCRCSMQLAANGWPPRALASRTPVARRAPGALSLSSMIMRRIRPVWSRLLLMIMVWGAPDGNDHGVAGRPTGLRRPADTRRTWPAVAGPDWRPWSSLSHAGVNQTVGQIRRFSQARTDRPSGPYKDTERSPSDADSHGMVT